ncbi:hypothetical protein JOB18_015948 [Solea senegalensis]|uniref:Reverse transcriptase/retrotransposon-derived protein RNase H-like domain-containing protein n=1 Tax=Solea senegalensis TaxID=28829 RepID=A0AAV6RAD8_SOLSE|nr:hypothetical protein JOB18_015948 [Solea senegalensis]
MEGKKERMEEDGAYGRMENMVERYVVERDLRESKDHLRAAMAELAADVGMTGSVAAGVFDLPVSGRQRSEQQYAEERSGAWRPALLTAVKTPKYSRLIDRVLSGVPRQQCLVYLDDILVHGDTFGTALSSLRLVLGKVCAAGLKLHSAKCHFMKREVTFLGHRLEGEGLGTLPDKVQAVMEWPTPDSQKLLKSFLGLASYYRRFVRGFACIAAPLFKLLEKGMDFVWTEDCREAFNKLKRALSTAPVLTPADPSLPFILDTDASNAGAGGVLSQRGLEGERVVAYFSKSFNKAERHYA